jgi:hypothetical protein
MDFFQELLRCPQIQGAQKPKVKRSNLSVGPTEGRSFDKIGA